MLTVEPMEYYYYFMVKIMDPLCTHYLLDCDATQSSQAQCDDDDDDDDASMNSTIDKVKKIN
ncbi:hypothetical protein BLOT_010087 [Blomia tropicalis]|nr:hypothetical protein BLOT_010087 [Blomia tropicalis]